MNYAYLPYTIGKSLDREDKTFLSKLTVPARGNYTVTVHNTAVSVDPLCKALFDFLHGATLLGKQPKVAQSIHLLKKLYPEKAAQLCT